MLWDKYCPTFKYQSLHKILGNMSQWKCVFTAQKLKFFIKDFFSKCDQIRSFLWIWSHLLKKSLMKNFIFCAVILAYFMQWMLLCPKLGKRGECSTKFLFWSIPYEIKLRDYKTQMLFSFPGFKQKLMPSSEILRPSIKCLYILSARGLVYQATKF